jgi:hypothetical protein
MALMMLRTAVLLFALLVSGPVLAADAVFPTGSHIGLVPPAGMTAAKTFPGFEDRERKAAIVVSQVPGQAYDQFLKAMNSGAINLPGVSNAKREVLLTESGAAHLVVGDQEAEGTKFRKWLMITRRSITGQGSDANFSFIVTAQVPAEASDVYPEDAIRKALASATLRAAIPPEEILDTMPFRVTERANFEGVRLMAPGQAVMLTERAGPTEIHKVEPLVMVSVGVGAPTQPSERASFAQNVLRSIQGFNNLKLASQDQIRVGGQPTDEIRLEGQAAADDTDVVIVQWIRFGVGGFIRIVGVSPKAQWSENFTRFRQIRDGINARE